LTEDGKSWNNLWVEGLSGIETWDCPGLPF
jgi:hypothetical protein